ncbi:hypothetical protein BT93_C0204 [Corymbia citriodora subsp. variegata]|uniref:Uncharacterized protein n=1 Tax=Corymbia citriodora subsp. variegata TaxID=360336 RepID=A0A8T0CUD9_CORYI|nr:hypothetical protein BT93_L4337 [Corymbia citriodora subsp. variegata]KAF8033863.1 hypothetical protein BT93_C0204 [Corymbia citriodora subsp. variegata]
MRHCHGENDDDHLPSYRDIPSPLGRLFPYSPRPANAHETSEAKDKAKNYHRLRVGRHKRRHSSVDLQYDALSYAMNFDEGGADEDKVDDELPSRNFISRLPASPIRRKHAIT